jgi:hypothetical protein
MNAAGAPLHTGLHTGRSEQLTTAEAGLRVTEIAREATNQAIARRPPGGRV